MYNINNTVLITFNFLKPINSIQEGTMSGYQSEATALKGLGGWLIWFQIRCYLTIAFVVYQMFDPAYIPVGVVTAGAIIAVLVLFYMRKLFFRTLYVMVNGAGLLVFMMNLLYAVFL